jgi:demethylmenaquinone methyltransferase/2-methoxy-6-polyprenyl-1,4-benzoquinol methylase
MKAKSKKTFIRGMFDDIAGKYDFLNTILSFGQDRRWRRIVVKDVPSLGTIIDLCSGGGELALELLARNDFTGEVVLADMSPGMLSILRTILPARYHERRHAVICDVENLPFKNGAFNGAISAFSLRNLTDLRRFSAEARRVLASGSSAHFLEIAHPPNGIVASLFKLYFYRLSPLIARLFTSKSYAYRYLPKSLLSFPYQDEVSGILGDGWQRSSYRNICGGMAAIYSLEKVEE